MLTVTGFSVIAGLAILIQDAVMAAVFGAGPEADAYQLAMSFPTTAQNVFSGGAVLAVMVPRLVQHQIGGDERAAAGLVRWARRALGRLLLVVVLAWVALYPLAVRRLADDLPAATQALSALLALIVVPGLLFTGLASIEAAVLNSHRRFALLSAFPAFVPVSVSLAVAAAAPALGIMAAAAGALAGSVGQWLSARALTNRLVAAGVPGSTAPPGLVRLYGSAAFSAALLGGILLTDTWMASAQGSGATATFGFATRPVILLLAFATTAVGNVALPSFSRMVAQGDFPALQRRFTIWCGLLLIVALPAVALVYLRAPDVVRLLFERGTFGPTETERVAAVQQVYVLQVPFFLIGMMGWRVMNSLERNVPLMVMTGVAFASNLALDLALAPTRGLVGVAWGTNVAFGIWALLLTTYLLITIRRQSSSPPAASAR